MNIEKKILAAVDIEEAVLGCLLYFDNYIPKYIDKIKNTFFYTDINRVIFESIYEMYREGKDIDMLTLVMELKKRNLLDQVGGAYYISKLTGRVSTGAGFEEYLKILEEFKIKRDLERISYNLINDVQGGRDVFELLDDLTNKISNIYVNNEGKFFTLKDAVDEVMAQIYLNKKNPNAISGVPTGFSKFDSRSGGLQGGNLIVIAGETSQGKTSLAINIAVSAIKNNYNGAFFSLEMTKKELAARIISQETDISSSSILYTPLNRDDISYIETKRNDIDSYKLYIDDGSTSYIEDAISSMRAMVLKHNIKFAIFDYLQLIKTKSKHGSKEQQVGEITRDLKNVAKELNIPIILLSQLSRDKINPYPTLNRLRDSGQIEEAADIVMFAFRPEYYVPKMPFIKFPEPYQDEDVKGKGLIIVAKGRSIGCFDFLCSFNGNTTKFSDYHEGMEITGQIPPNESFDSPPF